MNPPDAVNQIPTWTARKLSLALILDVDWVDEEGRSD
jgi:hypothetical protein